MKRALAIGLAAGLVLTLTAAADQTQRFRWLGVAGRLALLAADEGGPREGRTLTVTAAPVGEPGPNGTDSFVFVIKSDCGTRTVQLTSAKAYAAGREIVVGGPPPSPEAVDPGSAFERVYNYACSGTVPDGPPVWIEGVGPARTYAIERGSQTERRQ